MINKYIIYLIIINIITFIIFGLDKLFAIHKKRRVSEKSLFILSLLGGCFLEFIGMFVFRHKTLKIKFYIINIIFIFIHSYIIYKII